MLTCRETQVLNLIGRRLRCRQIARVLAIGESTVRKHRANICSKLGFHNTAQLVAYALRTRPAPAADSGSGPWETLRPRECEIVRELCRGQTSKQIARRLRISHRTVEKHRQNAMRTLYVHDMATLMRLADGSGGQASPSLASGRDRP
ncbi:LuxR C-terminal-related transcriptional regulator [Xanthomonas tesorieronis]|uniref:LuxR C-terminal-related transcriptional regulator n=1 Tax=Xanthomonas tesorieronis TaxID=3160839 RepID=UPI0035153ED6